MATSTLCALYVFGLCGLGLIGTALGFLWEAWGYTRRQRNVRWLIIER